MLDNVHARLETKAMSDLLSSFAPPGATNVQEEGFALTPKFDHDGLVPAIAQDAATGEVLMLAYMNAEALARTIESGQAWYWSRSRQQFWRKGETSGHTQRIVEIRLDCDQDAVLLRVAQTGPACHTHRASCFYRRIVRSGAALSSLEFIDASGP